MKVELVQAVCSNKVPLAEWILNRFMPHDKAAAPIPRGRGVSAENFSL